MKKRCLAAAVLLAFVLPLAGCAAGARPGMAPFPEAGAAEAASPVSGASAVPAEAGAAVPPENALREEAHPFLDRIAEDDPAVAYVLVTLPDFRGLLPLPAEGEYARTVRQERPDGSVYLNVLLLTPEGFRMEEANCEGHDCVLEGEVTLSNREDRVLWNMVVCLPHQLSAELVTRAEAEQLLSPLP